MHLNQLYGYFGRRKTLIETKNVYKKDLIKYYGSYTIFSEINIKFLITLDYYLKLIKNRIIYLIKNYKLR